MAKDAPQAKDSAKVKDQPKVSEQSAPDEKHSGAADAARDAWSGMTRWGRKAAEKVADTGGKIAEQVGDTSVKVYKNTKEAVQSEKGQAVIKQGREGAARAIEAVGGRSDNATVNQITRNAKLVPGAGNIVDAAETLSRSGVTGIVRDGRGTVNKEELIRGAVKSAPLTGDLARAMHLADRAGVTDQIADKVQEQVNGPKNGRPHEAPSVKGVVRDAKGIVNTETVIRGAVNIHPAGEKLEQAKEVSDKTGFTDRVKNKVGSLFRRDKDSEKTETPPPEVQQQERQKVKR
ncbi:MAG: hypothetical protein SGJ27_01995 [Candidatus Melainabacteria bacterium]|nr:hypothetical protein [Candidatus Melainabacteria bacterium]